MLDDLLPPLSADEERQLFLCYAESGYAAARDAIWTRNIALAVNWVAGYCRLHPDATPYRDDILADMVSILPRVIDKFDPSRGFKFSTYYTNSMTREMHRSYQKYAYAVRVPKKGFCIDARSIPFDDLAGEPTDSADPVGVSLAENTQRDRVQRNMRAAVAAIRERDRVVLSLKYGLDGEPPMILADMGERLGISKEGVRQRLLRATEKLLESPRVRQLAEA